MDNQEKNEKKFYENWWFWAICIFLIVWALAWRGPWSGLNNTDNKPTETVLIEPAKPIKKTNNDAIIKNTGKVAPAENSPAYNLASLQSWDSLGQTTPSQGLIDRFESVINSLVRKCPERTPVTISDLIVFSQQKLKEGGKYLELLQIAEGIDDSLVGESIGLVKCSEAAAVFTFLTIKSN